MGREEAQKPPTCSSLFGARISLRLAMEDFSRGKKGAASAASRASKSVVGGRGAVQPSKPSRCPQTLPPFLSSLASHSPVSSLPPPNPTQPNPTDLRPQEVNGGQQQQQQTRQGPSSLLSPLSRAASRASCLWHLAHLFVSPFLVARAPSKTSHPISDRTN